MTFVRVMPLSLLALLTACPAEPNARPSADDADPPVSCSRDEDCGPLACGPCTSGTLIRTSQHSLSCVVNPCPGTVAVCNPRHVCAVR